MIDKFDSGITVLNTIYFSTIQQKTATSYLEADIFYYLEGYLLIKKKHSQVVRLA